MTVRERDGYTEWNIEEMGTQIDVSDVGYDVSNVLVRTNSNQFRLNLYGSEDFTIQNFGVDGVYPEISGGAGYGYSNEGWGGPFQVGASGTGTFDTVYLGDGGTGDWRDKHQSGTQDAQPTGVFSTDSATGLLEFKNMYMAGWTDNTFYVEHQGATCDVLWENVYVENCDISAFRPGSGNVEVINCHATNNNHRDFWARTGNPTVLIDGCHFDHPGAALYYDTGDITVQNSQIASYNDRGGNVTRAGGNGQNPNPTVPDPTPTTAMEAATGSGGGDGNGDGSQAFNDPVCVRDLV